MKLLVKRRPSNKIHTPPSILKSFILNDLSCVCHYTCYDICVCGWCRRIPVNTQYKHNLFEVSQDQQAGSIESMVTVYYLIHAHTHNHYIHFIVSSNSSLAKPGKFTDMRVIISYIINSQYSMYTLPQDLH